MLARVGLGVESLVVVLRTFSFDIFEPATFVRPIIRILRIGSLPEASQWAVADLLK
jgi:hypothetical protein